MVLSTCVCVWNCRITRFFELHFLPPLCNLHPVSRWSSHLILNFNALPNIDFLLPACKPPGSCSLATHIYHHVPGGSEGASMQEASLYTLRRHTDTQANTATPGTEQRLKVLWSLYRRGLWRECPSHPRNQSLHSRATPDHQAPQGMHLRLCHLSSNL